MKAPFPARLAILAFLLVVTVSPAGAAALPTAAKPERTTEPDIALLYAAGNAAHGSELMPGLSYRLIALPAFALKVHAWSFADDKFRLRVTLQKAGTGSHVRDLIGPTPDVLVINGGFFDRDKQRVLTPSGLVIMGGSEVSPEQERAGSGIIYWGAAGVGIGYRKDLTAHGIMTEAIQVGPILVDPGGKVSVTSTRRDRQNRSAACLSRDAFVIVAVDGGLSLYQLAQLLAAPISEGGFGCDAAINLDGGPSTQTSSRAGSQSLDLLGGTTIQNALVVSAKPSPQ